MGDEVVEEIAVQIQRVRLQRGQAIEPRVHRFLAAVAEADVRVADDEDPSRRDGRDGHGGRRGFSDGRQRFSSPRTRSNALYSSCPNAQNTARCRERAREQWSSAAGSIARAQRSELKPNGPVAMAGKPTDATASSSARSTAMRVAAVNFASA